MRRLIGALFALFVFAIGVIAAAVFLVPKEVYKSKIEEQASALLGRNVEIAGDISLYFFPNISASASDVRIANPNGFSAENFAKMDEMQVGVKLLPLFSKRVEITEFTLIRPQISLEKKRNEAVNWAIGAGDAAQTRAKANAGFARTPGALPLQASLGDVRIEDGSANYIDRVTGTKTSLSAINLQLKLPDLDKKMSLSGGLTLNGNALSLNADLASLRGFLEGEETELSFKANSDLADFSFDGAFLASKDLDFAGLMELEVPSVKNLAKAADVPFAARPNTFGRFAIKGQVKGRPDRLRFTNADLSFDQIKAKGEFAALFTNKKPKLTGKLQMELLDLNPYLPPVPPPGTAIAAWTDDQFDLVVLRTINGNFKLDLGALRVRNIEFGSTQITAGLLGSRFNAKLVETTLYGGSGTAHIVLNAKGNTPSFSLTGDLTQLQALPFFTAAAGFERLDGIGELHLNLLTSGHSTNEIAKNLSGSMNLHLKDGAVRGINLASVLRNAQTYLLTGALPSNLNSEEKTDFSDLKGSFQIKDGVARNTDMVMLSPLIRVTGMGEVNLGQQSVDYQLTPKAVASLKGQGGNIDLKGLSAPFRIHGPWNDIKAGLDTSALTKKLENRAKSEARKLIEKNVGGDLGKVLQGFLGSEPEAEPDPTTNLARPDPATKSDEEKALDVLGGLLGFGKRDEPAEPETDE
ncbi:MAG: hypothetical protein COA47_04205 [Robiginitomaculum sp.]|nr:MAG: hypothetical protein COA47_04205 [Robiginitomaculum sp.]